VAGEGRGGVGFSNNEKMLSNDLQQNIFLLMMVGMAYFGTSGSRILMNGNSGLAFFNVGNTPTPLPLILEKTSQMIKQIIATRQE
jgi:hypothetical protein